MLTLTGGVDHGPGEPIDALHESLRSAGAAAELLNPAQAAERWPGMRFDDHVLFQPDAGRVHADQAVGAFQEAAVKRGADVRHGVRVADIVDTTDGVVVTTTSGEGFRGDAAVVSAGGWTTLLMGRLGGSLRTTQEQPAHFPVRDPATAWPSFIHHPGGGLNVEGGVYGLASTDGIKVGFHGSGPESTLTTATEHRTRRPCVASRTTPNGGCLGSIRPVPNRSPVSTP